MRAPARLVAAAGIALGLPLLASAPAAADDCSTLVEGIGDLGDEYILQDCLRTGSNWGRVIGTVVGVSGATIAAVGLRPRGLPTGQDTGPSGPSESETDPCRAAAESSRELLRLAREKEALEIKIVAEWKQYQQRVSVLVQQFQAFKDAEYYAVMERNTTAAANIAKITGLAIALWKAAAALKAAAVLAADVGLPASAAGQGALVTAETAAKMVAADAALAEAQATALIEGLNLSKDLIESEGQFILDPLATKGWQEFAASMGRAVAGYRSEAKAFNQAFRAWGQERQRQLDQYYAGMDRARARYLEKASLCLGEAPLSEPPEVERIEIHVLEAPVELGGIWTMPNALAGFGQWVASQPGRIF